MLPPAPHRLAAALRPAAFALALAAACAGPSLAQDARIVVGQSIALSGGVGEHGQLAAAGAKLYLDGVNAAGGIGGRRIVVVTRDDGGDATRASSNVRELIEREGVVAMLGGVEGGPCVATLKEASGRGVPLVACMAGSCSGSSGPTATRASRSCTRTPTPGASTSRTSASSPSRAASRSRRSR